MKANQMLQNGEYLLTNGSLSLKVSKIEGSLLPCNDDKSKVSGHRMPFISVAV